ncbi:MAG: SEC-C metal-binding domain-containing protein, partial [Candidatus Fonsibacter sp.]
HQVIEETKHYKEQGMEDSKKIIKIKTDRLCGTKLSDEEFNNWLSKPGEEQRKFLSEHFLKRRSSRVEIAGDEINKEVEKRIFLQNLDFEWRNHIQYLEQLRQVIGLRGYGQKNPLDEYKRESFNLFKDLLNKIKENLITFLINIQISKESVQPQQKPEPKILDEKISRNAPCPCGSGKKFKNYCGALN